MFGAPAFGPAAGDIRRHTPDAAGLAATSLCAAIRSVFRLYNFYDFFVYRFL